MRPAYDAGVKRVRLPAPVLFSMLGMLLTASCNRLSSSPAGTKSAYRLHILAPSSADPLQKKTLQVLKTAYPDARIYPADDAWIAASRSLQEGGILLVANADYFPVNRIPWLMSFLESGGRLLLAGPRPFSAGIVQSGRKLLGPQAYAPLVAATATPWLPPPPQWQAVPGMTVSEPAENAPAGWRCASVSWTGKTAELSTYIRPGTEIPDSDAVLFFQARSRDPAVRITVLFQDDGGSWFRRDIPLQPEWQLYALGLNRWQSSNGRIPVPSRIRRVVIGATSGAPGRETSIAISEFRIGTDPWLAQDSLSRDGPPLIELQYASLVDARGFEISSGNGAAFRSDSIVGVLAALPRGWGGAHPPSLRAQPILTLRQKDPIGWTGAVFYQYKKDTGALKWGWLGVRLGLTQPKEVPSLLDPFLRALARQADILCGGTRAMSIRAGAQMPVSLLWNAPHARLARFIRPAVSLETAGGRVLYRQVGRPGEGWAGAGNPTSFPLVVPESAPTAATYQVRCEIAHVQRGPEPVDWLAQPVQLINLSGELRARPAVRGSGFALDRSYFQLIAVRWTPSSLWRKNSCPLVAEMFDPGVVERDLALIKEAGCNAVLVPVRDPAEIPQLYYFGTLAGNHQLWLVLELPDLSLLSPDFSKAEELLQDIAATRPPALLALQFPVRIPYPLDEISPWWSQWLAEQYGNPDRAEKLWGPLSLRGQNELRVKRLPLFRRFIADFTLRRCAWLRQLMSNFSLDNCLLGLVVDAELPSGLLAGSLVGARLADYAALKSGVLGQEKDTGAGYLAELARGLSGEKPVCLAPELSAQASWHADPDTMLDNYFQFASEHHLPGVLLPASCQNPAAPFRVPSILDELGRPAPWANALPARVRQLVSSWSPPPAGTAAEVNPWSEEFDVRHLRVQADGSIREIGWGKALNPGQARTFGRLVGQMPQPVDGLNAVWVGAEIDGKAVIRTPFQPLEAKPGELLRLALRNTGAYEWKLEAAGSSSVAVTATEQTGSLATDYLQLESGGDARQVLWYRWRARPGTWKIRARYRSLGEFGEALIVICPPETGPTTNAQAAD